MRPQRTVSAIRISGGTAISAEKYDTMAKIRAFLGGDDFGEDFLDFPGVL